MITQMMTNARAISVKGSPSIYSLKRAQGVFLVSGCLATLMDSLTKYQLPEMITRTSTTMAQGLCRKAFICSIVIPS